MRLGGDVPFPNCRFRLLSEVDVLGDDGFERTHQQGIFFIIFYIIPIMNALDKFFEVFRAQIILVVKLNDVQGFFIVADVHLADDGFY